MEPLVEVRGVALALPASTRSAQVLDGVSFTVSRGERVALLGASGSGKSTLLRVIDGLQPLSREDHGLVRISGRVLQGATGMARDARAMRRGIGLVFQQFQLAPQLDLLTNVLVGAVTREPLWRRVTRRFSARERALALRALEEVGLAGRAAQRTSTLSGGQQQRAAIARALVQGSELLLADEPVASLDPETARQILELLVGLQRERQATLVVSLHQVELARAYFERAIALRRGRVIFDGPTSALRGELIERIYRDAAAPPVPAHVPPSAALAEVRP
ncbi:MAG: ATP-binding cassette domain-containing protein [Planctomycetota bacterium]